MSMMLAIVTAVLCLQVQSNGWAVSYAGGVVDITGPTGGQWSLEYDDDGYGGWGGGGVSQDSPMGMAGPGTVVCSGGVTATLTWVGSGNRPKCIIVRETSSATWSGDSGSADNGLGFTEQTYFDGGASTGVKYRIIQNPGATETITCEPSADAFVANPAGEVMAASAGVNYKVEAAPLYIELSGGRDSGAEYLIGQELTAKVKSPFIGPLTVSSRTWSVSGGDPFMKFEVDHLNGSGYYSSASRINLGTSDFQATDFKCCFAKNSGTITIECAVNLTVPTGDKPTGGLSASLTATTATILPTISKVAVTKGEVGVSQSSIHLKDQGTPKSPVLGIYWESIITTPSAFIQGSNKGSWHFVQTLDSSRQRANGSAWQTWHFGDETVGYYRIGLDGTYPYEPPSGPTLWPADSTEREANDTPAEGFESPYTTYLVRDDFEMYVMYLPPGTASQWVPLRKTTWHWGGRADLNSGTWAGSSFVHDADTPTNIPAHPTWLRKCRSSYGAWLNN